MVKLDFFSLIRAQVLENASLGMHVVQCRASDLDFPASGDNSRLRFSILSGDPSGDFSIGDRDGLLAVARSLDYERRNSYRLVVRAEDAGGRGRGEDLADSKEEDSSIDGGRFDTATVVVTVLDVNDNPPRFPDAPFSCRVRENAQGEDLARPIFVARAEDRDDPPFDRVEYSIRYFSHLLLSERRNFNAILLIIRDSLGGLFSINSSTAEVFATRPLDRESVGPPASFRLHLIAQDFGSPRLTAEAALDVIVDDENDGAPEFQADTYEVSVAEDAEVGASVGRVSASDQDEGLNAQIR